jgi:hypothetical protein
MNKFVIGALALTSAGSLAYAGGGDTKEWSTLDHDILNLTSSAPAAPGITWTGYVRARGALSNDVDVDPTTVGTQELSGFSLDNARLIVDMSQGDYGAHISLEAVDHNVSGDALLLDAYATGVIANGWMGQIGRFRTPFLGSALVEDSNMLLLDHTFNGQVWQARSEGVQLTGTYDRIALMASLQNGSDALANGYMWAGRVTFTPMGTIGNQEGAYGANPETSLRVGASYADDSEITSSDMWAVDGSLVQGGFSLQAEMVNYHDGVTPDSVINTSTGVLNSAAHAAPVGNFHGSETPWSGTAGLLVGQNIEIAVRYEDLDDSDNTTAVTLGLNVYAAGHNAKFTLQGTRSNSDIAAKEADTIAFGVCVGI